MRKTFVLILVAVLLAGVLCGCAGNSGRTTGGDTRTITDMLGREVEIPIKVETIVPLANTPRMITYLGLADRAVGIGGMSSDDISPVTAYAYANKELWADLPVVGTDSMGATDYYPEEIIKANPDLILCSYTRELADEIQTKTGIPVVAVPMGTLFGEDYEAALRLLADVCGVPERAETVIAFINGCLEDLKARTAEIPEKDKPSVLGAAATFKGSHGIEGVYIKYTVFETIGANDVTADIPEKGGAVLVDKEKIIDWDPEFVFLDSSGVDIVRTDFRENPDFYAHLSAVRDRKVYQYPSSTSYYSNVEIPLVNCYYVGTIVFPEQFADIDFEEKANEIFEFFLGAKNYIKEFEASGSGYGKVTLKED
ncbi:MAG: ABC transporter substrate-binding protein [Firmicutes bacterium]|nr:ABC transporter substrate-binding protein [Bacillota bacterium]